MAGGNIKRIEVKDDGLLRLYITKGNQLYKVEVEGEMSCKILDTVMQQQHREILKLSARQGLDRD